MKLKKLLWNWTTALKLFPVAHLLLLAISIIWIWNIHWNFSDHFSFRFLIALVFSFLLSCLWPIVQIHSDFKNKNSISWIMQVFSILLWWIYYLVLLRSENVFYATYSEWLQYFWILIIAALSIPLAISLLHKKQESKTRFSRECLFVSILFWWIAWSIVRWWTAWALWSIESLFGVNIDSERYQYLWVFSEILLAWSFTFNYYLTLIENINKSEFEIAKSRTRKIFWSFIFLPLALIYLLIFWAYWIKILITWVRPNGKIIWLWIWYFSLWIISSYLIYPDKTRAHEVINKILKVSFILVAFMMIWAISKRIEQYWITINRWFICYIIAFIIIFSAFSLIFSNKRLFWFVTTLFVLALLVLYWPISAGNISFKSQVNRLTTLLSKENISLPLEKDSLKNLNEDSVHLAVSIVNELIQKYNKSKVYSKIISYDYKPNKRYSTRWEIREYLWIDPDLNFNEESTYFSFWQDKYEYTGLEIAGFSMLYKFHEYELWNDILKIDVDNDQYEINLSEYIPLFIEKSELYRKSDLTDEETKELNSPALVLDEENYRLIISWFYGEKNAFGKTKLNSVEWYFLIK